MNTINENCNKFLFGMFAILPIIDSINGFLVNTYDVSLGTVYKMLLIAIIILKVFTVSNLSIKKFITTYHSIIFSIVYIITSVGINLIISDLNPLWDMIIKLIFNIVLYYSLYYLLKNQYLDSHYMSKLLYMQSVIIILCLLIPFILRIGYYSYAGNLGYKGFFYSHNELNATLLILFYYNINILYKKKDIQQIIITILLTICLFLMSSKSSMIGCLVGWFFYILLTFKNKNIYLGKKQILFALSFLCIIFIVLFPFVLNFFTRQIALFNNFSGNIISTITSGRNLFVENAWTILSNDPYFIIKLFIGNGFASISLIEMDLIDTFFYLGVIGVIILLYWLRKYITLVINHNNDFLRLIGICIIFLFSFFTGHIVFTATASTYCIIYCLDNLFC